jgi:hypothetical protein
MNKGLANKILTNLDETANLIDKLAKDGKVNPKVASELTRNIDSFADRFQVAAFGKGSLENWRAKLARVDQMDSDEIYMKTYENPQKVLGEGTPQPYLHESGKSFNCDSIPTYDSDDTSQVTDRKEYDVRDLNEYAGGTKPQPSWTGGRGGKSTRQGAKRWSR